MAVQLEGIGLAVRAAGAIPENALVEPTGSASTVDPLTLLVDVCDATPTGPVLHAARAAVAAEDALTGVRLAHYTTFKCIAAGAIAIGAELFYAAGGKVDDSGTVRIGVAGSAAGADGDYVTVIPD